MLAELDASGSMAAYAVGIPLVLLLIAIEAMVGGLRNLRVYKREDTLGSLGLLAGNVVVNGGIKAIALALNLYIYEYRLFDLSSSLPIWTIWLLSFVAIDFVFYWFHRLSHRVRFLWAIHMNHHCSQEMNFVVAFRQPWLAPIVKIPFFAVLPLIGLDPTITLVAGVMATLWGVVGHTKIVGRLWAPIEWVLNTPSHHRVHHGSNARYIDKNYGNIFIIWDRMFGTFEPESEPVIYGLRTNIETNNPLKITVYDWRALFSRMGAASSVREAFGYFFGPPGWQPAREPSSSDEQGETGF